MPKIDKQTIWKQALESLKVSVSSAIYSTCLTHTHILSLKKADKTRYSAEIGCSNSFIKQTLEQRYFGLVQDTLIKTLGAPCDLSFSVKSPVFQDSVVNSTPLFEEKNNEEEILEKLTKAHIRPGHSFENFAVSGSNQMAHAACEAVARQPGMGYNPLFIWGGVGVGKTHLMYAVGHKLLTDNINAKILACTSEEFGNDIIEGIRNKTTNMFREKYRKLEALFVDDIQFIAGKDSIQEEFFHTFNAVTGSGGHVILTSDKPPGEIEKMEPRLKSRFEAGMIVDIAPPDFELRSAIVQIKAEEKLIELNPQQVELIAGNLASARQIEGFLTRLSSETKVKQKPITEDLIMSLISGGVREQDIKREKKNPDEIIEAVCAHYSVGRRNILGKARTKIVVEPRQIIMYLLRTELGLPLEEVGRLLGGRDHSTIIHGVDKITNLSAKDVDTREDIKRIKSQIWG